MSQFGATPVRPTARRRPVVAIVLVILLGLGSSGVVLTAGVLKAIWKLPTPTAAYRLPGPAKIGVGGPGEWGSLGPASDVEPEAGRPAGPGGAPPSGPVGGGTW